MPSISCVIGNKEIKNKQTINGLENIIRGAGTIRGV